MELRLTDQIPGYVNEGCFYYSTSSWLKPLIVSNDLVYMIIDCVCQGSDYFLVSEINSWLVNLGCLKSQPSKLRDGFLILYLTMKFERSTRCSIIAAFHSREDFH